jgi:membrane fusion protein (multidrug efflux system)
MSVVALDQLWVDANFKEAQLGALRIGQPATLTADVYGRKVRFRGTVGGLGAGTGAAFALLPAQNATGNWIKVVQRLPVRIQLDPAELREHPLQIGLSMQVDVNTHGAASIPRAQPAVPLNTATRTDVFRRYGEDANAEIARIIAQNSTLDARSQTQLARADAPRATAPQM